MRDDSLPIPAILLGKGDSVAKESHLKQYHWQQVLAGVLRALECDRQLARGIAGGIYGTYGRTDVLDMHNFVEWVSRDDAPPMVSEVEALIAKHLAERKAA
jgi:hypothetical protein